MREQSKKLVKPKKKKKTTTISARESEINTLKLIVEKERSYKYFYLFFFGLFILQIVFDENLAPNRP